ncbi:S-type pyocin domain-containing protein [Scandinavium sp.]|uniref:S-type pyocin domain-containing protein n=1 Tax=Scandinavium sp. TaxID=2830653 RepID=UPI00289D277B|nr:S-type pyocin domain-containing protein [Scandinavium sp.]
MGVQGYFLFRGDKTVCGGRILEGWSDHQFFDKDMACEGHKVTCGKHPGHYRICGGLEDDDIHGKRIAGTLHSYSSCPCKSKFVPSNWDDYYEFDEEPTVTHMDLSHLVEMPALPGPIGQAQGADAKQSNQEREYSRVFAKSCLRGEGCNDAGREQEPHSNFAVMGFFRAAPVNDPSIDSDVPQHAQTAKKKPAAPEDIPKPKKRSALYKWLNGNHEEMDYQAAVAAAASATRAQTATAGVSVLEQVAGRFATYGTWAVRGAEIATAGAGASVAGFLVGMMPGRLNDGEQDFIDRMRLSQMSEAPTRVRFSWENDANDNPVPHGWHTPPGKDMVRVRKMQWDNNQQAYTFTTEEENPVTIIWTPDQSGTNKPWNTGNQTPPRLPSSVIVDPLPDNTEITTTSTPAPDEKSFADYILILPISDIPPIYIYLNSDHKYHTAPKGTPPLPAFPDAKRAPRKTAIQGGGQLRARWKDAKGKIYEWDSQHGTVEVYDRSGRNHLGEFNHITGEQTKPADPTRKVEK